MTTRKLILNIQEQPKIQIYFNFYFSSKTEVPCIFVNKKVLGKSTL